MKNVIRKAFSLLLVSVVAVSMFSFITPNRVDAEVYFSNDYIGVSSSSLFIDVVGAKPGYCAIKFFYPNGNLIAESRKSIKCSHDSREEKFYVPLWTAKIEFEAVTMKTKNSRQTKTTFTAIPDMPRSNVGRPKEILGVRVWGGHISTNVFSPIGRGVKICTIFNYISETL